MKILVEEMPEEKEDCLFCFGDLFTDSPEKKCELSDGDCLLEDGKCPFLEIG